MKAMLALLLPLALSGCMLELLTTTAIQGELAAKDAQASAQALRYAKDSTAKTEAQYAIRAYQAEKGSYPPTLAALVPGYLPSLPMHSDGSPFGYDPATGTLLDSPQTVPQGIPFTPEDRSNLKALEDAVFAYWQATSDYPAAIRDLAPNYIATIPMLSSGGAFIYDAQTGAVYHPNDLAAPAAGAAPVGAGGGAGSLGEATTGIAIQNQLGNMNNSGVSNAGGAARRGISGASDVHNRQQQQALDALDQ